MPELPHLSGREIIRALERMGFEAVPQSGSHVVMRRVSRGCAVPLHKPVRVETLAGLLRQAQVDVRAGLAV
jgi:predicted RNA binding protein YcfA (HicA-like mRNA interferase family)